MDQDAEQFWRVVLETDLERRLHVVHARKRHIVGQGAVAGNIEPGTNSFKLEFVDVRDFGEQMCIRDR